MRLFTSMKKLIPAALALSVFATMAVAQAAVMKSSKSKSKAASSAPAVKYIATEADREEMVTALSHGDTTTAKKLNQKGVSYDVLASDDMTGLMRLADEGDEAGIKTALGLGASLNAKNSTGESAIWYAVYSGHEKIALEFLKKGASAEGQRPDTKDCLMHMAAQAGLVELGTKLMKLTPKCASIKDADGRTPSAVAKSLSYTKLAKILTPKK